MYYLDGIDALPHAKRGVDILPMSGAEAIFYSLLLALLLAAVAL